MERVVGGVERLPRGNEPFVEALRQRAWTRSQAASSCAVMHHDGAKGEARAQWHFLATSVGAAARRKWIEP